MTEEKVLEGACARFTRRNRSYASSSICPGQRTRPTRNYCDITARLVRDRIVTISCLDNLIKGAAGAAVQNFNLMYGPSRNDGARMNRQRTTRARRLSRRS